MFDKFKERFNTRKSDDMFVEAAINPNARQKYIEKLVSSRTVITRALTIMTSCFFIIMAIALFRSSLMPHAPYSQNDSIMNLVIVGLMIALSSANLVSIDLAIKFLKALDAGVKQAVTTES